jgi:hypothetical protein
MVLHYRWLAIIVFLFCTACAAPQHQLNVDELQHGFNVDDVQHGFGFNVDEVREKAENDDGNVPNVDELRTDDNYIATPTVKEATYKGSKTNKGIVLMSINWGRQWSCGGYENAQLAGLGFDLLSIQKTSNANSPDLFIKPLSMLAVDKKFDNYAFQLEPGTYGISYVSVKAAKSISNIGFFISKRSDLIQDKTAKGGSFTVGANEVVYIGNFWLDCAYSPMLWRYYTMSSTEFTSHLSEFANEYPFLPIKNTQYRLFSTSVFGNGIDDEYKPK